VSELAPTGPDPSDAPCTRCATPLERGDLRCAVCALPRAVPIAPPPDGERARVLRCTSCGAAVAFSAEAQAPRCSFCHAVMEVEQPVDPIERAEAMLPFTVQRAAAQDAVRTWLGRRGWFAPRDLASASAIDTIEPLCWAGWLVEAGALVSWAADSDAGSGRSAWAPHTGVQRMRFENILVPASRGLSAHECAFLTPRYDVGVMRPIDEGGVVESFDAQRSAARRQVVVSIEAMAADGLQRSSIPGRRFRKVKVAVQLEHLTTKRLALPVWVLAYRYRGVPYRALVHGQDAAHVTGSSPMSARRLLALIAIIVAVIAAIVTIFGLAAAAHR
jgi:hypothetical protein